MPFEVFFGWEKDPETVRVFFKDTIVRMKERNEEFLSGCLTRGVCFSSYGSHYEPGKDFYYGFQSIPENVELVASLVFKSIKVSVEEALYYKNHSVIDEWGDPHYKFGPCGALENPTMVFLLTRIRTTDGYSELSKYFLYRIIAGLVRMLSSTDWAFSYLQDLKKVEPITSDNLLFKLMEINSSRSSRHNHCFYEGDFPLGAFSVLDNPEKLNQISNDSKDLKDFRYFLPISGYLNRVIAVYKKGDE